MGRRRRLLAGIGAGAALLLGPACSDAGEEGEGAATAASTEATVAAPEEEPTTTTTTTVAEETTTTIEELTNAVVQAQVEADHPAEAALVDWAIFRWVYGFGYTARVPDGATPEQAVAVCAALAEVLDAHAADDAVLVVAGAGETAVAGREDPGAACAAV